MIQRTKAPGLVWIKRRDGKFVPIWVATEADRKAGYRPKTMNLSRFADDPKELAARCDDLQCDMLAWRSARDSNPLSFDGTIASLISCYLHNPESPYRDLRPGSKTPYNHYLSKIVTNIGSRSVDSVSGLDLKRWHGEWSSNGKHPAAATMCSAVLDAAVSFGVMARLKGCSELSVALKAAKRKLPRPKSRTVALSASAVTAARKAAHKFGRPSSALAYALAFETTLRLYDVIGQWWPRAYNVQNGILDPRRGAVWFGLTWEDIGPDLVLRYLPGKTSGKTGRTIIYPLTDAPMVMEELAYWRSERRIGPVIVCEASGKPYTSNQFASKWRDDRDAAGIPAHIWARDLRASGITEGRASAASLDDAAKVAGHASIKITAAVYDRANLEAAKRFATARVAIRTDADAPKPPN